MFQSALVVETIDMQTYVTYLESALDGTRLEPGGVHTVHKGRPLWVRYDLPRIRTAVSQSKWATRPMESRRPQLRSHS